MRGAAVVLAVGAAIVFVVFAVVLSRSRERMAGSNQIPSSQFVAFIGRSRHICQGQEIVPADAASLHATIGAYGQPTPPLHVRILDARGRLVTRGTLPAGWREGVVSVPIGRLDRTVDAATVCLRAVGGGRLALGGYAGRFRIEYVRPGRASWLDLFGTIMHRFGIGKAPWEGAWTWLLALALVLATTVGTGYAVLRGSRA